MSDLKRSCPACDAWTSAVGIAFRDGDPCPYCGLPASAAELIDQAQERHVSQKALDRLAEAEIRATKAESTVAELRGALGRIRLSLNDADRAIS